MSTSLAIRFPKPTVQAVFKRRYQRFLADMQLSDGSLITAHTPNTGSMKGCLVPDSPAILWDSMNPKRKYRYSWKAIKIGRTWVGIDTGLPNELAAEAIRQGVIPDWREFTQVEREVPVGTNSRLDLLCRSPNERLYVEVKNVTLVEKGVARFPDAPTTRGTKHLRELIRIKASGNRAAMLYVVQRSDAQSFEPADDIDPEYAQTLLSACQAGVEVVVLSVHITSKGATIRGTLPGNILGKEIS